MKGRSRAYGKSREIEINTQEAIRRLAACQLCGRWQTSCVIVDADASTFELLNAACLGRSYQVAQQVVQAVECSTEHSGRAASPSKASASFAASATSSSREDLEQGVERPLTSLPGEGGVSAAALGYAAIWGATSEIGKLGVMPINLPALQAAQVASQSGIALSRLAAENLRQHVPDSHCAEEHPQQKGLSRRQKQDIRRGKHGKRSQPVQQELGRSSMKVWLLSLEEAFFMHYALKCLAVSGESGPCSTQVMWEQCMRLKPGFVQGYLPFHHFRSKGWVVRPGAEYGVDYVLYDGHPSVAHSSYCILALTGRKRPEALRWTDIEAASRACSEVLKKLLLLYVFEGSGISMDTPHYLSAVTVEERLVQRWSPGQK